MLYLLARVADTIADSKEGETEELKRLLNLYNDVAQEDPKPYLISVKSQAYKTMKARLNFSEMFQMLSKAFRNIHRQIERECLSV